MAPNISRPNAETVQKGMSAWNDFSKNASVYDAKTRERIAQENAAVAAEYQKAGKSVPTMPPMNETWNKVVKGDLVGQRQIIPSTQINRDFTTHEAGPVPTPPVRSRYQDIFDQNERSMPMVFHPERPTSPLTPPPETEFHPVFSGVPQRPVVRLPGSLLAINEDSDGPEKPVIRVKLPPPMAFDIVKASVDSNVRASLSPMRAQPFVANPTWQERINGLFDRKVSNEKKPAEASDFSTSKMPLELSSIGFTSVALPPKGLTSVLKDERAKTVEEEDALFEEERDFGSTPPVRIPAMAPVQAWNPAKPPPPRRARQIRLNDSIIMSGFNFIPGYEDIARAGDISVVVSLPGMQAKTVKLPRTANFRVPRPNNHQHPQGKQAWHKGKSREHSSSQASAPPTQMSSGRPAGQQNGGSRKSSSAHNSGWGKRAAGVVQ